MTGGDGMDSADDPRDEASASERTPAERSAPRRPTRAASAASRARRIGGAGRAAAAGRAPSTSDDTAGTGGTGSTAGTGGVDDADAPAGTGTDAEAATGTSTDAEPATDTDAEDNSDTENGADTDSGSDSGTLTDPKPVSVAKPAAGAGPGVLPPPPAGGGATGAPPWLKWATAGVLGAAAIVMAVLVLVAAHSVWYAEPSSSDVRDQVLAAAKTCTAQANTYSYTSLDKDEAAGAKCTTGRYTSKFTQAFNRLIKPQATKLKASQSVQVNAAGIETVGRDQWTVVVYGQTRITQSGVKPRTDPFAAEVTMQRAHGDWLIEDISLPSGTN